MRNLFEQVEFHQELSAKLIMDEPDKERYGIQMKGPL
jgi:hypothetical protein